MILSNSFKYIIIVICFFVFSLAKAQSINIIDRFSGLTEIDTFNTIEKAEAHLKNASLYDAANNSDSALFETICAYNIYKNISDFKRSSELALNIGKAYERIGYYSLSIDYYQVAYDYFLQQRDSINLARVLNQMGNISLDFDKHDEARNYYAEVLNYNKEDSIFNTAKVNANIGNSYYLEGESDTALYFYKAAMSDFNRLGDELSVAKIQMSIGNAYLNLGSICQAKECYLYSKNVFEEKGVSEGVAMVLHNLGNIAKREKDYILSENYYRKSIRMKEQMGMRIELLKSYESIADLYGQMGYYKDAYKFEKQKSLLSDSLQSELNYDRYYEFQTAVNVAKWQDEVNLLQKNFELSEMKFRNAELKIDRQQQIRQFLIFLLCVFVAVLAILVFLFRTNRSKRIFLRENNEILNSLNIELKESIETKDKLFSIMAHDLKNPIVGLARLSKIMHENKEKIPPDKFNYFIKEIFLSSSSLNVLLKNLTQWTAFKSNKIEYIEDDVNVEDLINRTINLFKPLSEERKVSLFLEFECDIQIRSDSNMLSAILRNLIGNAVKFTQYGSNVTIRVSCDSINYWIEVVDEGVGISEQELKKVLSSNADMSKIGDSPLKGTGLGLNICRDFAQMLDGEIQAEKVIPVGTKFKFIVPLIKVI